MGARRGNEVSEVMETTQKPGEEDGDAVLIAFERAGPEASLADWLQRYPEHAGALARLALDRWAGEPPPIGDAAEARVRAIGLAVFRKAAPLASLKAAAQERGLDPEAVAARLGLPVTYFWKLNRRLFAWASLPTTLVAALAEALGRGVEDVAAYLQRPPTLAPAARYRSDDAPRLGAGEDFAETLRADREATDAQRARWLDP
jgi:hypothetical protein